MDPFHHGKILFIAEVVVVPAHMPGVEGVVPYHVQCLLRQCAAIAHQDLVQVLIMAKGQQHLIEATVRLVYPILCARERERERLCQVLDWPHIQATC